MSEVLANRRAIVQGCRLLTRSELDRKAKRWTEINDVCVPELHNKASTGVLTAYHLRAACTHHDLLQGTNLDGRNLFRNVILVHRTSLERENFGMEQLKF